MGKREMKRVKRGRRLSAKQIAKDKEVRRKIETEFPPVASPPIPNALSETLKSAIRASDMSLYQIAKRARVSQIIISRFLSGERDIRMATADKLANALELKLVIA